MKNEILTNENKGFSLVELIVVIAIMAVMTSVLAPSLLGYVEQSRMAKDDSAMGEVNNAIKLALADQDVYDECLIYNVKGNFSCYVDGDTNTNIDDNKILDKEVDGTATSWGTGADADYWHFNDNARLKDETLYVPAGNMRGMTLTFTPEGLYTGDLANEATFKMADARVNEVTLGTIKKGRSETARTATLKLSDMQTSAATKGRLYNKLRAVIGDNIVLSSQTYRNSEYTVFIRMGSMGGNQVENQDAVAVYGQWSGTNLYSDLY